MSAADTLRHAMPLTLDGPLVADILESLQMVLAEPCPVCGEYDFVCGRCSVRSNIVRRLLVAADDL